MSAVIALATPRRIKASHRRRRKVASDHLLYILNNPLSGTDPTGYACSTGTHVKGEGGPNCESTGASGTPMTENPTKAQAIARPQAGGKAQSNGSTGKQGLTGADERQSANEGPEKKEAVPKKDPNQLSTGQRVGSGVGAIFSGAAMAGCVTGGLVLCPESVGVGCIAAATCAFLGADVTSSNATEAVTGRAHTPVAALGFSMLTGSSRESAENGENMALAVTGIWSAGSLMQQIRGPSVASVPSTLLLQDLRLSTGSGQAVFWSGIKNGDQAAAAWAAKNGGTTLEMALAARGVSMPAWNPNNPAVVSAWRLASRDFAAGASGNVRVLQANSVRTSSVWAEVEFPALMANRSVTSITAVNPETGMAKLLWSR